MAALRTRKPGERHPYVIGNANILRTDDRGGVREGRIPRDQQACGDQQPLDRSVVVRSRQSEHLEVNAGHSGDRCIARLWLDQPQRCMGGRPLVVSRSGTFVGYSDVGGVPERPLHVRPYLSPFYAPVLFASPVTPQASSMRGLASSRPGSPRSCRLARAADSSVPRSFPLHLLLTTWRVLTGVLATRRRAGREPRKRYWGEQSFPHDSAERSSVFPLHRVHLPVLLSLRRVAGDALARWRRRETFGVGVGTILLAVNVVLLSSYTLGCHAMRTSPAVSTTKSPARRVRHAYACSTALNYKHRLFRVEPFSRGLRRLVSPTLLDGDLDRLQDLLVVSFHSGAAITTSHRPRACGPRQRSGP